MAGLLNPSMEDGPEHQGAEQGTSYVSPDTIAAHQELASTMTPGVFQSPRMTELTGGGPARYPSDASPRQPMMGEHGLSDTGLTPQRALGAPVKPGASFEDEPLNDAELASKRTAANATGQPF
jgi:hypothetical protein